MPTTDPELLTAKQAARRLGIHVNTLKRWLSRGTLPYYRIGDREDIRLDPEDIDAWLATKRQENR